jgi:protein required for attachment to host cells
MAQRADQAQHIAHGTRPLAHPPVTWVVVADGAHARIYFNNGIGKGLAPVPGGTLDTPNLKGREIVSDRPGRSFDSGGQGRHAMESDVDPQRHEETQFLRELAQLLEERAKSHAYDRLVLVAPPRALGALRQALAKNAQSRIVAEVDKDLVAFQADDIAARLGDVIAL